MTITKESIASYASRISDSIFITTENGFEKKSATFTEKTLIFNVVSATIESIEYSIADTVDIYGIEKSISISEDEKEKIITASADTAESIIKKLMPYVDTIFSVYYPIKEYFEAE